MVWDHVTCCPARLSGVLVGCTEFQAQAAKAILTRIYDANMQKTEKSTPKLP
jgi:hypothetical protein